MIREKKVKRILILGAAGPSGVNVVNSLRLAKEKIFIIGTDSNKYHLEWPNVNKIYRVPHSSESGYQHAIKKIIKREKIDFIHAQPDSEVKILSEIREEINTKTLLPSKNAVRILQDKEKSAKIWRKTGLHNFETIETKNELNLKKAINNLGLPVWMRAKTGAGARGSTLINNVDTAIYWLKYWQSRKVDWSFIIQPFLSGRDYAFQSLWHNGELINSQARERLEYIFPHLAPSGKTGTPTVAKTIHNPKLNRVAVKAITSIDPKPNGIYSVDLVEDKKGKIYPTEINAGRFFTTTFFYSKAGLNQPYQMLKLALGQKIPPQKKYNALPANLYWIRHIDCPAVLVTEKSLKYKSSKFYR